MYITDLKSHHGTHILRPGETVSQMIAADSLHELADGDVVTFGKTVGKEDGVVRPVTARIRHLFSIPRLGTPPSPTTALSTSSITAQPSSTGRYGVYSPAMDSSGSDSSSDSEMDTIPRMRRVEAQPPLPAPVSLPWNLLRGAHAHYPHAMHHINHTHHAHPVGHASNEPTRLSLLRRILPQATECMLKETCMADLRQARGAGCRCLTQDGMRMQANNPLLSKDDLCCCWATHLDLPEACHRAGARQADLWGQLCCWTDQGIQR